MIYKSLPRGLSLSEFLPWITEQEKKDTKVLGPGKKRKRGTRDRGRLKKKEGSKTNEPLHNLGIGWLR